jgi:hypothetical protein
MKEQEFKDKIKNQELTKEYYSPSESMEWCDAEGNYYNNTGNRLRSPEEYNPKSEGYTPFGDE